MKYISFFSIQALITIVLYSCDNPKVRKIEKTEIAQITDRKTYVQIKDATTISSDWLKKNTVIYHVFNIPETVHLTNGYTAERSHINKYTQKTILENDIKVLELVPGLVTGMPEKSENELTYEYTLRDDVYWDNGDQLTTEDIVFTFKTVLCPLINNPQTKPLLSMISDIKAVDKYSFIIEMKEPHITAQHFLPDIPILQKKFHDPNNTLSAYTIQQLISKEFEAEKEEDLFNWATEFNKFENGINPSLLNGLGAYKIKKWDTGQSITLKKKEDHWTEKLKDLSINHTSYPDEIIFVQNRDPNSILLEFKAQNIDVSTSVAPDILLELQKDSNFNKNYHSSFVENFNYSYMALNTKPDGTDRTPFFINKKVRKAIAKLVPVEDIIAIANKGVSRRSIGPISTLKESFNNELKPIEYDLQKAKQLLKEAGWEDTDGDNILDKEINGKRIPFTYELHYMNVMVQWEDVAKIIKESMEDAGIQVKIRGVEPTIIMDKIKTHDFDAMLAAWSTPYSADDLSQAWHTSAWANGGMNFSGFGNPESDALIDSMNSTTDLNRYNYFCKKFQEIVYEEQPYVFLNSGTSRIIIHKRFGNANMFHASPGVALNNLKLLEEKKVTSNQPAK